MPRKTVNKFPFSLGFHYLCFRKITMQAVPRQNECRSDSGAICSH